MSMWYDESPVYATNPPRLHPSNLTRLKLNFDLDIGWLIGSLHASRNLEELTIDFDDRGGFTDPSGMPSAVPPCTLPKLRMLKLQHAFHQIGHETDIFKFIKMPALEHLDLSYDNEVEGPVEVGRTSPKFLLDIQVLATSTCGGQSLRYLRVDSATVNEQAFPAINTSFPFLTHLVLDGISCTSNMFWRAAEENPKTSFLRLETLEILNLDLRFNSEFVRGEVEQFFSTRRPAADVATSEKGRLRKVVITLQRQGDPNELEVYVPSWVGEEGLEYNVSVADYLY